MSIQFVGGLAFCGVCMAGLQLCINDVGQQAGAPQVGEQLTLKKGEFTLLLGALGEKEFGIRIVNDKVGSVAELALVGESSASVLRLSQAGRGVDIVMSTVLNRTVAGGKGSAGLLVERAWRGKRRADSDPGKGAAFLGASGTDEMAFFAADTSGKSHTMGRVRKDGASQLRIYGTGPQSEAGGSKPSYVSMSAGGEMGVFGVVATEGRKRLALASDAVAGNTTLRLLGPKGEPLVDLSADDSGGHGLTVSDRNGTARAALGMSRAESGALLQIVGADGKRVFEKLGK